MDRDRVRTVAGIAVAVVLVVGFGLSRVMGPMSGGSPEQARSCEDPVAWDEASEVVGRTVAVQGPVAAATYEPDVGGSPTFVNLGNAHPDEPRFDAVIYQDVRVLLEDAPEEALPGLQVCVHGEVRDRDGVPQIVVDTPEAITRP